MENLTLGLQVVVPAVLLLSLLLIRYLDPDVRFVFARLRSRLLLGIPWGTITAIGFVLFVYLFVQRGFWTPYSPLSIPFTSWSYLYPLGTLTAPFAHQGFGHLLGNLIGFAAFGPIAEYAFSHFPTKRGNQAFSFRRTNPYVRAFLLFPSGVIFAGLVTSVFAWGPIIGFSGVVFAAAGFALVRYPLATVIALVGREFIGTLYYTLRNPIVVGSASPSFGPPWWAGIAIQGHLLGFLTGVVLASLMLSRRRHESLPTPGRLWLGTVVAGSSLTLWALWWYRGASSYVLYRGPGMLMLLVLGVLVASAVNASERPIVEGITRRELSVALLAVPVLTMGFVAVPLNVVTLQDGTVPGEPIQVDGYEVTYAENVPNQRVGAINVSFLGETTQVNSSGVIVVNRQLHIWDEAASTGRLANSGFASVQVGGLGWRETVRAKRDGWRVSGGGTAYVVSLRRGDNSWRPVFESDPVRAEPVLAGRNVTVVPTDGDFVISVTRNNSTLGRGTLPPVNRSVQIGGLNFTRRETRVYAAVEETRVPIFERETYR